MKIVKIFISQPMRGKSAEDILAERERAIAKVRKHYPKQKVEIIDSYFANELPPKDSNKALYFLGKALEMLARADVAYFAPGWAECRGCKIEHEAAVNYGIEVVAD